MLKIIALIMVCLPLLGACASAGNDDSEENMSITIAPSRARAWLERYPDAVLLDVRSAAEFATGHIRGAVNLPVEQIDEIAYQVNPATDALLLVYCRSGVRSYNAASRLRALGYTRAYDFGGILDWPYGIVY